MPRVTVITAAYNSSRTLRVALASLRKQSFTDWEAWIVGDACTDDSGAVVAAFGDARLHWMNLETNHGSQAYPNNEALRRATTEYVAYLGHDDLWLPDHLRDLVRHADETRADFVHSICGIFDARGWAQCFGLPRADQTYEDLFIPPSCWLHRRDLIQSVGYWADPDTLEIAVDLAYSRRVFRAGKTISCCPRLSVVKIPSITIGLYAVEGLTPQEALWQHIDTDLAGFEHDLLSAIAAEVSRLQRRVDSMRVAFRGALGSVKRAMFHSVRNHPWMVRYRFVQFQKERRENRVKRGLVK